MLFNEPRFLAFFAVVFSVHWLLGGGRARKGWLLVASYVFYAAWDWRFAFLILASTGVDFVAGARIAEARDARGRRAWLLASLVANLGILGFFKYFDFFVSSAGDLLVLLGLPAQVRTLEIVLPVGISFFTFQSMSYTIDIHRGRLAPTRSFADFALFVSFFPQLVAGPIVRARGFLPQLAEPRRWAAVDWRRSLAFFLLGFVKKACIADTLAAPVDQVFAPGALHDAASHWLGVALYGAQIYCDFSGYTDMAIGTAGLLGYRLVPNFDFPYLSRSVREFWRRWHQSLSSWFRDYLYLPLGGNRAGAARTYRNLATVFLLCGLWHGAAWTFVAWGALHGLLLVAERGVFGDWLERRHPLIGLVYTQGAVGLAWVLFRAADLPHAASYLAGLVRPAPDGAASLAPSWWAVAGLLAVAHAANARLRLPRRMATLRPELFVLLYGALVALALLFVPTGHRPFIYFQF